MEDLDLIYDKVMDGESLSKEVMEHHGYVTDENGKSYWWNTIDRTKTYRVKKYEYDRALQYYSVISYKIKEI